MRRATASSSRYRRILVHKARSDGPEDEDGVA